MKAVSSVLHYLGKCKLCDQWRLHQGKCKPIFPRILDNYEDSTPVWNTSNIFCKEKEFSTTVVKTISLGKCLHYLQKGILPLLLICNSTSFSKMGDKAFTEAGFKNWRKAVEIFKAHEGSHVHREAKLKWMAQGKSTIDTQISSQMAQLQMTRRQGLLIQLMANCVSYSAGPCHSKSLEVRRQLATTTANIE